MTCSFCSESRSSLPPEWITDNSKLGAETNGIRYRKSKSLQDVHPEKVVEWNSKVRGVDEGDGWLRVDDLYLPLTSSGVPVLRQVADEGAPAVPPEEVEKKELAANMEKAQKRFNATAQYREFCEGVCKEFSLADETCLSLRLLEPKKLQDLTSTSMLRDKLEEQANPWERIKCMRYMIGRLDHEIAMLLHYAEDFLEEERNPKPKVPEPAAGEPAVEPAAEEKAEDEDPDAWMYTPNKVKPPTWAATSGVTAPRWATGATEEKDDEEDGKKEEEEAEKEEEKVESPAEEEEEGEVYVLDNSLLKQESAGIGLRGKKSWDAPAEGGRPWGSTVRGVDEGDGWLRVGKLYLPMAHNGIPIVFEKATVDDGEALHAQLTQPTNVNDNDAEMEDAAGANEGQKEDAQNDAEADA